MLVLSRKVGETIKIGDAVEITVNRISASTVSLAVSAPRDIHVIRSELVGKPRKAKPAKTQGRKREAAVRQNE